MPLVSASAIAGYARAAGFTGAQIPVAVAVALAESSGNTTATHKNSDGSTDFGLWQINSVHADILASGTWSNPADNAKMARAVYLRQGWNAWSTYKSGAYMKHINSTQNASLLVPNPLNPGAPLVPVPGNPLAPFDALKALADPHTYLRLAMWFAGLALIVLSIVKATGTDRTILTAAKSAAKVAVVA